MARANRSANTPRSLGDGVNPGNQTKSRMVFGFCMGEAYYGEPPSNTFLWLRDPRYRPMDADFGDVTPGEDPLHSAKSLFFSL